MTLFWLFCGPKHQKLRHKDTARAVKSRAWTADTQFLDKKTVYSTFYACVPDNKLGNTFFLGKNVERGKTVLLAEKKTIASACDINCKICIEKLLKFYAKNISFALFFKNVLFFGKSARRPLFAHDTTWAHTHQLLPETPKFLHKTTAFFAP